MSRIGFSGGISERVIDDLYRSSSKGKGALPGVGYQREERAEKPSFVDHLREGLREVNRIEQASDTVATDLATGKQSSLHETMLAVTQAELTFHLMVQVRNKALEAYQEMMRMPV